MSDPRRRAIVPAMLALMIATSGLAGLPTDGSGGWPAAAFADEPDDDDEEDPEEDDPGGDDVGGDDVGNDGSDPDERPDDDPGGDDDGGTMGGGGDDDGGDDDGGDDGGTGGGGGSTGGGDDDDDDDDDDGGTAPGTGGGGTAGGGGDDDDDDDDGPAPGTGGSGGSGGSGRSGGNDDDAPGGAGVRGVSTDDTAVRDGDRDRGSAADLPDDVELDNEGRWVRAGEILALEADAGTIANARARGFTVVERVELQAIGLSVVRLRAPAGRPLRASLSALREGDPDAAFDFNHLYFGAQERSGQRSRGSAATPARPAARPVAPARTAIPAAPAGPVVGLIDSAVVYQHPSLRTIPVQSRDFARAGGSRPNAHGTAVASLLAGQDLPRFRGAAPGARIVAATVVNGDTRGEIAAADSIVRALDWMAASGVPVINISLAGPPNALLEQAIERVSARGIIVVAAVGNDGPLAPPAFPAAYAPVVAVTAVDSEGRIYRRAIRGTHVDLAAPGVGVVAADGSGRYVPMTGTSFAAPTIAGLLAERHRRPDPASAAAAIEAVLGGARDAGVRGRDPVFGVGVVSRPEGQ